MEQGVRQGIDENAAVPGGMSLPGGAECVHFKRSGERRWGKKLVSLPVQVLFEDGVIHECVH